MQVCEAVCIKRWVGFNPATGFPYAGAAGEEGKGVATWFRLEGCEGLFGVIGAMVWEGAKQSRLHRLVFTHAYGGFCIRRIGLHVHVQED
jgi:hypothetical protein